MSFLLFPSTVNETIEPVALTQYSENECSPFHFQGCLMMINMPDLLAISYNDFRPKIQDRLDRELSNLIYPKVHLSLSELDITNSEFCEVLSFLIASGKELSIRSISCSDSPKLTKIPPEIGKFTELDYIEFNGNNLTKIADEIRYCTKIKILDLHNNQLTSVPNGICAMKQLQQLGLAHNQIKTIPKEIANMRMITNVDLSYNLLVEIPSEILHLGYLRTIDVRHNNLISFPCEVLLKNIDFMADVKIMNRQRFQLQMKLAELI